MLTLNPAQHIQIKQMVHQHAGMLPVSVVQQVSAEIEATIDQLMLALLPLASEFALRPISGFSVGAVALGETGNLYLGANLEFSHVPLCQSVHAEQAAVAIAHHHGETRVEKIAISASPCGHCRQFLMEQHEGGGLLVLLQNAEPTTLTRLLPHAFGPKDLHASGGLLTPQQHSLVKGVTNKDQLLEQAALAAERSYAPYSKAYSGVALQTRHGKVFSGSYLENAVFNPSLPALQSALVGLIFSGVLCQDITEAVLVQVKNNIADQAESARMLLTTLNPAIKLQFLELADKNL